MTSQPQSQPPGHAVLNPRLCSRANVAHTLNLLPEHPMVTLPGVIGLLKTSKPTASKAIDALCRAGVLHETTGKRRDRVYAYQAYLKVLTEDTAAPG